MPLNVQLFSEIIKIQFDTLKTICFAKQWKTRGYRCKNVSMWINMFMVSKQATFDTVPKPFLGVPKKVPG